jgi:site-specific recombinase XerD
MEAPLITIFVRHSADCKYAGDEFCKRCNCRKHLRWTQNGKQYRRKAGTRSWGGAEDAKRRVEEELSGRKPVTGTPQAGMQIADAVELFMRAKRNDGLELPTLQKLQKTCDRIREFSEGSGVFMLEGVTLIHLTTWPWGRYFNTTHSIRTNQERAKSFFRYFHNAGVISKNPAAAWKRTTGKVEQASGFTAKEYEAIVKAAKKTDQKLHALIQLMRFAGLAIIDAACLERSQIVQKGSEYRVRLASRQKTSKKAQLQMIDNAIPPAVGRDLLAVLNGNPRYVFWNRASADAATDTEKRDAVKYWQKQVRALLDAAGLPNATSHKFRHTLAIEMIRHGATFEDVAAALGNTVGVVAKFYSHEWSKVRQGRTDAAISATW